MKTQKLSRWFLPKLPRTPKPKGFYTRLYIGGILDGRTESAPYFRVTQPIKTTINKSSWRMPHEIEEIHNYTITQPVKRPSNGATYIYKAA